MPFDAHFMFLRMHSSEAAPPLCVSWLLSSQRHYGALQGRSKLECIEEFGKDQVKIWRNAFDIPPPLVSDHSPAFPGNDPMYEGINHDLLPRGECLKDTLARCSPFWEECVEPELREGRSVVIAAHGHSIRALVKRLDGISDEDISKISMPNGIPLVYHLDEELRPIRQQGAGGGEGSSSHDLLSGVFLGEIPKVKANDMGILELASSGSDQQ
jgi:2,3-bisphosphoglycerate-dependent phosphoglycerate mutase